jgi:putative ATP-binding cassette transporter
VQLALGFFVDNYARLSDWMAGVNRIVRLDSACAVLDEPDGSAHHIEVRASTENVLRFVELTVASPDGDVMIDGASATIAAGEKVLIQGDVGVGKSTLFRAIAGLWPWGRGIIERPPTEETMFVSHRPYVPVGTLRMALAYPSPAEYVDTAAARQALTRCGLGRLADHLDVEDRWDQVLSEAEQQRLAFARLLLHRPAWIVIDEATSELDGAAEADLMAIFRNELAASTLVTVAQRSNLAALHDRTLALVRSPAGSHLVRLPDRLSQPSLLAAILGRR